MSDYVICETLFVCSSVSQAGWLCAWPRRASAVVSQVYPPPFVTPLTHLCFGCASFLHRWEWGHPTNTPQTGTSSTFTDAANAEINYVAHLDIDRKRVRSLKTALARKKISFDLYQVCAGVQG